MRGCNARTATRTGSTPDSARSVRTATARTTTARRIRIIARRASHRPARIAIRRRRGVPPRWITRSSSRWTERTVGRPATVAIETASMPGRRSTASAATSPTTTPRRTRITPAGFPTTCDTCHKATDADWQPGELQPRPFFPLVGVHKTQPCAACHKNNVYAGTPRDCVGCHQTQYDATTNPKHVVGRVPDDLRELPQATDATGTRAIFNHDQVFPLVGGARAAQPCAACHENNVYTGTPRDCVGCHQAQYNGDDQPEARAAPGSRRPARRATRRPTWLEPANFNHDAGLPADRGAQDRSPAPPATRTASTRGRRRDCVGCHQTRIQRRRPNPNHTRRGFPTTCENCHTTTDVAGPANFNHDQFFPLTGAHRTAQLRRPATRTGSLRGDAEALRRLPPDGLQRRRRTRTTRTAGFPTTCEKCHTTTAWQPANFNHDQFFPLTGAHKTVQCASCHKNGQYAGTPTTCVGCHQADYNGTTNPNHGQSGFPTTCETCHSTTAWQPSTFDHRSFFPIPHHGINQCNDCHTTGNSMQFSCIDCHTHNKTTTDSHHRGVGGYQVQLAVLLQLSPPRERRLTRGPRSVDRGPTGIPCTCRCLCPWIEPTPVRRRPASRFRARAFVDRRAGRKTRRRPSGS